MNKAVMISIRPEWCEKIGSGEKTIEVRKTRPTLPTPFKCYIYCTKGRYPHEDFLCFDARTDKIKAFYGGGKVIGEFTCDAVYMVDVERSAYLREAFDGIPSDEFLQQARLTAYDLLDYLVAEATSKVEYMVGYGWHITDLFIYGEPKLLTDFYRPACERMSDCGSCPKWDRENRACKRPPIMLRAPQSWCYVEG